MRESDPHRTRRYRQRRQRYAAAVLCLGTLTVAAIGAFVAEHREVTQGAGDPAHSLAPRALPAPRPVSSRAAAEVLSPSPQIIPKNALTSPVLSAGRVTGATAVPSSAPSPPASATGPSLAFGAALPNQSQTSQMTQSSPLTGTPFPGLPQVGALFSYNGGVTGSHFCSGSVVASNKGDIVVTAAHCVYDSSSGSFVSDMAFVPGYHDGQQPYGVWIPSQVLVAPQWLNDQDPDYDVAFLVVHRPGSAQRIQDAVGADQLGIDSDFGALTQVVGYPTDTDEPITCTDYTKQFSPTQLEFDCPGYPDGTSGGPFLTAVDPQTGLGTVSGVIGGYETGGDSPDVSYSTYFNDAIGALFQQAQAAG